ncbi:MAG: polysaccharide export protein [Alphaproteobacteria bacterium]|nr:polysaccharide export protein [Alphaproteobacteria bacterium]
MSDTSRNTAAARLLAGAALASLALTGCAGSGSGPQLPPSPFVALQEGPGEEYVIGPLDELTVFVWCNPELGAKVQVRPDGRITTPLITEMPAVGKTLSMLAEDIRLLLSQCIEELQVSVIVNQFAGTFSQQVRIVGATEKPASIPYRANMTLLDAMIAVGGLSEFAAGNLAHVSVRGLWSTRYVVAHLQSDFGLIRQYGAVIRAAHHCRGPAKGTPDKGYQYLQ